MTSEEKFNWSKLHVWSKMHKTHFYQPEDFKNYKSTLIFFTCSSDNSCAALSWPNPNISPHLNIFSFSDIIYHARDVTRPNLALRLMIYSPIWIFTTWVTVFTKFASYASSLSSFRPDTVLRYQFDSVLPKTEQNYIRCLVIKLQGLTQDLRRSLDYYLRLNE